MADREDVGALQSLLISRSLTDLELLEASNSAPDYAILGSLGIDVVRVGGGVVRVVRVGVGE